MSRLLLAPPLVAAACGAPDEDPAPPDDAVVAAAMEAARPEPLVELVDDVRAVVPMDAGCPLVAEVPGSAGDALAPLAPSLRQTWAGGCSLADGTRIEGTLELFEGPEGSWIASDGFTVWRDGLPELRFEGAVELQEHGDLLFVDAAASWCGGPGPSCSGGTTTVDLSYTLYPFVGLPTAYDVTVGGAVGSGEGFIQVEGTWSIDEAVCAEEPTAGTFAIWSGELQAVVLDGAALCDGCAAWSAQGADDARFCGVDL